MKLIIAIFILVCFIARAQTENSLTNHVSIGNRGISFSITDEPYARMESQGMFDEAVSIDAPLSLILKNTTNRVADIHFQGIDHAFSFKLLTNSGREVPLTEFGKQMNLGPINYSNRLYTGVRFIALVKNGIRIMDFPALNKLFESSEPGDYLFEIRFWYVDTNAKRLQWQLSDPVRLKVVKQSEGTITNSSPK